MWYLRGTKGGGRLSDGQPVQRCPRKAGEGGGQGAHGVWEELLVLGMASQHPSLAWVDAGDKMWGSANSRETAFLRVLSRRGPCRGEEGAWPSAAMCSSLSNPKGRSVSFVFRVPKGKEEVP